MSDTSSSDNEPVSAPKIFESTGLDLSASTTPTGTTVITRFLLSDTRHDPDQSLPSLPPPEAAVSVTDTVEGYFSFDKFLQRNPDLSWAVTSNDDRPEQQELPERQVHHKSSHESAPVEIPAEEYFSFDKFVQKNPVLNWASVHIEAEAGREEPVAATMSPSTHPARHSDLAVGTPASGSSSSDSMMRALLQPPSPIRVSEPVKTRSRSTASQRSSKDSSSSSDSMMRALLQPPSPIRVSEPVKAPSHSTASQRSSKGNSSSSDSMMRALLQPPSPIRVSEPVTAKSHSTASWRLSKGELMDTAFFGESLHSSEETSSPCSPQRHSKRRRTDLGSVSQSSSESVCTPPRFTETGLGDLDAKSALFLAKRLSPPVMRKPQVERKFSIAIDPHAVGLPTMNEVLRDGALLTSELRRDARALGLQRHKEPCPCDVARHPSWWTVDRIQDVHNYSFLLDCQGLELNMNAIVAANSRGTVTVYDVPMDNNNAVKLKAEQVLRFVDVEIGFGDQTCYNLFYYTQPFNRKMLLVVSRQRVVGIVVAEEIRLAHRILRETVSYMELEEDPVPVRVGINRLWVHVSMRRKHLASSLCHLIGKCYYENEVLHSEDYAFNNISDAMVMFAKVFLKTLKPPLYCKLR